MAAVVSGGAGSRLGVALSSDALCAAIRRSGSSRVEAWRVPLPLLNGDGTSWPALADALRTLARDTGVSGARLTVALMPPLAEARGVDLPALSDEELRQLLLRGAGKYFATARGQQVVGAVRATARTRSATVPLVAASANARLVAAIQDAVVGAGFSLEAIIPAEAAWGQAIAQGARAKGAAQLIVAHPDRTDLIVVEDGRLSSIRRFRTASDDARVIADAFPHGTRQLRIVGNVDARNDVARVLAARGVSAEALPGIASEQAESPDFLAAAFASPAAEPALVTDSMRAAERARIGRITARIGAAAVFLFVASLGLEWWGLQRELNAVKAERAALAPQISSTLVGRTTVENAFRQLAALGVEERSAPNWSEVIAGLSHSLPADAFFTGFRGRGDTISVDGLAEHAARAYDAIEKVPGLRNVRAAGPVRIETPDDGPPMERFAIAASLARAAQPATRPKPSPATGAKK